jgi:dihydrofolate reductase
MRGKVILNIAMSIDGYIARCDDSYDWIKGHGDVSVDTDVHFDYPNWLDSIDIVVMGKRSFDLNMHLEHKSKQILVATHTPQTDFDNVSFTCDLENRIKSEKEKGKSLYLFGGGKLIQSLVEKDLIDEYIIGIIPTILGEGIPLFYPHKNALPLKLIENYIENGMVILKYIKV